MIELEKIISHGNVSQQLICLLSTNDGFYGICKEMSDGIYSVSYKSIYLHQPSLEKIEEEYILLAIFYQYPFKFKRSYEFRLEEIFRL